MIKRYDNINTLKIETKKAFYLVSLERLKNGSSGQPRYKAIITTLQAKSDKLDDPQYYYTAFYTFTGHYCGDYGEAQFIVEEYENRKG